MGIFIYSGVTIGVAKKKSFKSQVSSLAPFVALLLMTIVKTIFVFSRDAACEPMPS